MKLPKLTCVAAVVMPLLSMGFTATAQQNAPWKSKLCKQHIGSCGILVTFNPPLKDVLLVPNQVTVDVPLKLGKVSKVAGSSSPREPAGPNTPSEGLASFTRSQKFATTH